MPIKSLHFKRNTPSHRPRIVHHRGKNRVRYVAHLEKPPPVTTRLAPRENVFRPKPSHPSAWDKNHPKVKFVLRGSEDRQREACAILNRAIRLPCQDTPA